MALNNIKLNARKPSKRWFHFYEMFRIGKSRDRTGLMSLRDRKNRSTTHCGVWQQKELGFCLEPAYVLLHCRPLHSHCHGYEVSLLQAHTAFWFHSSRRLPPLCLRSLMHSHSFMLHCVGQKKMTPVPSLSRVARSWCLFRTCFD